MIIGITGTLGAGKGTVVEYLKKRGFKHYSVRAFITEEIKRRGMPVNRDSMVEVGNDLRAKNGAGYCVEQLYDRAEKEGDNCIIESIRTVGEAEALKKKGKFYLFAVDANPRIRYDRISKRGTSTDAVDFEEFIENERREMENIDPNKQNIGKVMEMADFTFENDETIEELDKKVEEVLAKLE
ncbi:AAA family ATPase [Candidatus Woesearchaeota archaeon]|nr:AAA family ATPase [Candidatus Woesearchaeota archaeon]